MCRLGCAVGEERVISVILRISTSILLDLLKISVDFLLQLTKQFN